jgi:hypothetical protein
MRSGTSVNITLIGVLAGLVVGLLLGGLAAVYLFFTRSFRRAANRYVIHFGQLLLGASPIGGILLLARFWEQVGIVRRSSSGSASLYAFVLGYGCSVFFTIRAEIRWRKATGQSRSSNPSPKQPMTPSRRRILRSIVILAIVSWVFAIAFLARWPKPSSLYLGVVSWLCWFALFVPINSAKDRAFALQIQRFAIAAFACIEIAMLALYWKFRQVSPAFSSAAFAVALVLCIGASIAIVVMRRTMPRA